MAAIQFIQSLWFALPEQLRELIVILVQILPLTVTVILCVAFLTYGERKIIGYMQIRVGPNRVGPKGWFQPFADTIKLIIKEVVIPANANRFLFVVAPLLSIVPALAAWAVVPLFPGFAIADIDAGLLYVLALTSLASTASSSPAGRPIRNMRSWVPCVRLPRWLPTKSPWALRWSAC
jgi:NADH-quinone oxidoreductase subunit H